MAFGSSLSGIRGFMAESLVSRHVIPTEGLWAKAGICACGKCGSLLFGNKSYVNLKFQYLFKIKLHVL